MVNERIYLLEPVYNSKMVILTYPRVESTVRSDSSFSNECADGGSTEIKSAWSPVKSTWEEGELHRFGSSYNQ